MNAELRAWLKDLSPMSPDDVPTPSLSQLSDAGADYLEQIVNDGTLRAAFSELAEAEPELTG